MTKLTGHPIIVSEIYIDAPSLFVMCIRYGAYNLALGPESLSLGLQGLVLVKVSMLIMSMWHILSTCRRVRIE